MECFDCKKCAACCRQVGATPWGKQLALPNGICRYLNTKTNLCTIYDRRPLFCNIDVYYETFLKDTMDRDYFYAMNKQECLKLQKKIYKKERSLHDGN